MPISTLKPIWRESVTIIEMERKDSLEVARDVLTSQIIKLAQVEEMSPPIHIMSLASNGAYSLVRVEGEAKEVTVLAEYDPPEGSRLPAHTLLLDAEGRTARVVLRERKDA